jgi:serine protease Do
MGGLALRVRSRLAWPVLVISLLLALAACQTTGTGGDARYSIFFSPADHVTQLVEDGDLDAAVTVFVDQKPYFDDPSNEDAKLAATALVSAAAASKQLDIDAARATLRDVTWPAPPEAWPEIKSALADANTLIAAFPPAELLDAAPDAAKAMSDFIARSANLRRKIATDAPNRFKEYDLTGPAFAEVYPVSISDKNLYGPILAERLEDLNRLSLATHGEVFAKYGGDPVSLGPAAETLIDHFVARVDREMEARHGDGIAGALASIEHIGAAGLEIPDNQRMRVGFAESTSRSLLKGGAIEFPPEIEIDVPVQAMKNDLTVALLDPNAPEFVVVFQVALAKSTRTVEDMVPNGSRAIVGYKSDPNPAYQQAQIEMNQAQMNYTSAQSTYTAYSMQPGLGAAFAALAAAIQMNEAEEVYQEKTRLFQETPQFVETPIYQSYTYRTGKIKARKTMTVTYYIIDRVKGTYYTSVLDVVEREEFAVGFGVLENDPSKNSILAGLDSEEDVSEWEDSPATIPLSLILKHYSQNQAEAKPYKSAQAILADMTADRNRVLAAYEEENFEQRPLNDPRFNHVVAIFTGTSLGSGFYVRPDIVMTNYHVVQDAEFVELKTYDGQETFGKVIAQDARLDLALVKVQSRGIPVEFMRDKSLQPGDTVEAIGHPRGFEFTITRGIVSSIRREDSIVAPGGDKVLFVQTDADINPGNSGGPLFKGDLLVGVNDWGRTDSTGLNFAIHFSEALRFIENHLGSS